VVDGGLRFISEEQKEAAREQMRAIVADHLPGASAEVFFKDKYPAMPPTEGNQALLALLDQVSRELGQGPVEAFDPAERGAADISFVAPYVDGLDGLGPFGSGAHTPGEQLDLVSLPAVTKRAALMIYRLTQE
jgi:glutamate carboxypeptidase